MALPIKAASVSGSQDSVLEIFQKQKTFEKKQWTVVYQFFEHFLRPGLEVERA